MFSVGSYLDQYYSSSTPNFAVGSVRRRAVATGSEPGETRWRRAGDTSSESAGMTAPPAADLAMRNDTLHSPRVSPLLWFQQCLLPSLVVTSVAGERKRGKEALMVVVLKCSAAHPLSTTPPAAQSN